MKTFKQLKSIFNNTLKTINNATAIIQQNSNRIIEQSYLKDTGIVKPANEIIKQMRTR